MRIVRVSLCLGVLGLVAILAVAVARLRASQARPEYAEPPFAPLGPGAFALLEEREYPVDGTHAQQLAWINADKARRKYLAEEGAVRQSSARERQAVAALYAGKYVKARELAEAVLADDPTSLPGRFSL